MKRFSLSKNMRLPDCYEENGSRFPIHTGFRTILQIFRLFQDPEVLDADKHAIFLRLFFRDEIPQWPYAAFRWFVECGIPGEGSDERDFDFEQDAMEIYASFMQLYHLDLMECGEMHWWKFNALLSGVFVSDTPLSNKVRLRHMDDSEAKRKNDLNQAKQRVQIGENISISDTMLEKELQKRLMNGEAIADLLRR